MADRPLANLGRFNQSRQGMLGRQSSLKIIRRPYKQDCSFAVASTCKLPKRLVARSKKLKKLSLQTTSLGLVNGHVICGEIPGCIWRRTVLLLLRGEAMELVNVHKAKWNRPTGLNWHSIPYHLQSKQRLARKKPRIKVWMRLRKP